MPSIFILVYNMKFETSYVADVPGLISTIWSTPYSTDFYTSGILDRKYSQLQSLSISRYHAFPLFSA